MPGVVYPGGTHTWPAYITISGTPYDASALSLTVKNPLGQVVAGFPIILSGLTHDGLAQYHYDWVVGGLEALGTHTATWVGTANGRSVTGSDTVEVQATPIGLISPSLITPAQLREHITTTLPDTALQRLIDGNQAFMTARAGANGARTILRINERPNLWLFLDPPADIAQTIAIRERYQDYVNLTYVDLVSNDWLVHDDGRTLERLLTGTHPADSWSERVEVTYTSTDDTASRVLTLISLCKLDIQYNPGLTMFVVGLHKEQFSKIDYTDQKEAIVAGLLSRGEAMA